MPTTVQAPPAPPRPAPGDPVASTAAETAGALAPLSIGTGAWPELADNIRDHSRRRAFVAIAATALVLTGFFAANHLSLTRLILALGCLAAIVISFRLPPERVQLDPNAGRMLALAQGGLGITAILLAMHDLPAGHAVLTPLYVLGLMASPSPFNGRNLGWLAAYTLVGDFVVFVGRYGMRPDPAQLSLELLRAASLAVVFGSFVFAISRLIDAWRQLARSNARLIEAAATIQQLVSRDDLTGVLNRRRLVELLAAESSRHDRYGVPWSVCILDIDHFKRVNDSFGHAAGDAVLRAFAHLVEHARRPTDIFGRYGGEEFLLILPHESLDAAMLVAERIRVAVEAMRLPDLPEDFRVTVSIGIAVHARGSTWHSAVNDADAALYRAKHAGRNRVECATAQGQAQGQAQELVPAPSSAPAAGGSKQTAPAHA